MFGSQYHPCLASNCHRAQVIGKLYNVTKSASVFIVTTNTREKQFKIRKAYVGSWSQRFQSKTDLIPLLPVWSQEECHGHHSMVARKEGVGRRERERQRTRKSLRRLMPMTYFLQPGPSYHTPPNSQAIQRLDPPWTKPLTELEPLWSTASGDALRSIQKFPC